MDIIAAKPYAGYALKFKICRFLQMGVDALSVVLSAAALISAIVVCNSKAGTGMHGAIVGKLLVWPILMFLILVHSTSGVIFYLTKRRCNSEESWKIIYVTCNLSTSMIIQFAYLLGSQPVNALAKHNYLCIGHRNARSAEKAVSSIIAAAEGICQVASLVHFVAAFFPPPMYLVDVDSSSGSHEAIELEEMETSDTLQLGKNRVSFSADAAESPPVNPTELNVPPDDPVL